MEEFERLAVVVISTIGHKTIFSNYYFGLFFLYPFHVPCPQSAPQLVGVLGGVTQTLIPERPDSQWF